MEVAVARGGGSRGWAELVLRDWPRFSEAARARALAAFDVKA